MGSTPSCTRALDGRRNNGVGHRYLLEFDELQAKLTELAKITHIIFEWGSAVANILFMPKGVRITVLQPMSKKYGQDFLETLAASLGHDMQIIEGSKLDE